MRALAAAAFVVIALGIAPTSSANHGAKNRRAIVATLKAGLSKDHVRPLYRYAYALEAAGHRYNVSPYFLAAIAGVESTFGEEACGGNAWGIASCGVSFPTFKEGAWYTAKLLRESYINKGLTTPWAINRKYAASSTWGERVAYYMRYFFGSGPVVTYPRRP